MQVIVTTRHIDQNKAESLKSYIFKKIKKVERYTKSRRTPGELKVVLISEKFRNIAEIFVNIGTIKSTSSSESEDMHTAIDRAIDSVIKQLKRQTEKKIKTKRRSGTRSKEEIVSGIELKALLMRIEETKDIEETGDIRVERAPSKPMSVEEAVLQLRVSDMDFLMFRNSETDEINVIYKRKGKGVGLIAPK